MWAGVVQANRVQPSMNEASIMGFYFDQRGPLTCKAMRMKKPDTNQMDPSLKNAYNTGVV